MATSPTTGTSNNPLYRYGLRGISAGLSFRLPACLGHVRSAAFSSV
jgi:hypothetical protein